MKPASRGWESEGRRTFLSLAFEAGRASPCSFYRATDGVSCVVHGDDFTFEGAAGALMGIPVLVSRSGFTAWGVEIANQVGLTLIGRMRGQRFMCLSGKDRLVYDAK